VEWWDVHVRYRELHRRLDGVRADLVGLGLDSRGCAAYADTLRTRVDPRLADDAPRMASEASDEDWCDREASFEGLARECAAFQALRRGRLAETKEEMRHSVSPVFRSTR
jgi:hypothetical protein